MTEYPQAKTGEYPRIYLRCTTYNSQFSPTTEELLFGITSNLNENSTTKKFDYVTLFMRYYIYSCKLNNKPIVLHDFVNAVHQRDLIENTVNN